MSKEWYSVKEVAKELGLTEETIRNYIRSGQLVAHEFGNTYRIHQDDLQHFLRERRTRKDQ